MPMLVNAELHVVPGRMPHCITGDSVATPLHPNVAVVAVLLQPQPLGYCKCAGRGGSGLVKLRQSFDSRRNHCGARYRNERGPPIQQRPHTCWYDWIQYSYVLRRAVRARCGRVRRHQQVPLIRAVAPWHGTVSAARRVARRRSRTHQLEPP